jgi:ADP-ribosylglycohydrolase
MTPIDRALLSLEGLSVGDAFGELFFSASLSLIATHKLPPGPWPWTDDTHMALSVVEVLKNHGRIDQDALARRFAERFAQDPYRGYAGGAIDLLTRVSHGEDWRRVAPLLFRGTGSYGNGAAMRAAPIGGFFAGDPARAAEQARLSAVITHAHPEGQAGAMAVAVAAAIAASPVHPKGREFLREVLTFVPDGETRKRIELSLGIPSHNHTEAVQRLGTGVEVSVQDTVPFCLWSAAYHLDDFEQALWWTASGWGDCDTTCAIVGGIVALTAPIPAAWIERREPLPEGFKQS